MAYILWHHNFIFGEKMTVVTFVYLVPFKVKIMYNSFKD